MKDILTAVKDYIKDIMGFTTTMVFILSGIYLLLIDGSDLKTKGMIWELKASRIIGVAYISGAVTIFLLLKYLL